MDEVGGWVEREKRQRKEEEFKNQRIRKDKRMRESYFDHKLVDNMINLTWWMELVGGQ